jgi:hypothetical protein
VKQKRNEENKEWRYEEWSNGGVEEKENDRN